MNLSDFDDYQIATGILKWVEEEGKDDFDTEFVDNMIERLENGYELNANQSNGLRNIVIGFEIDLNQYV